MSMTAGSPVEDIAQAVYTALIETLPDIEYESISLQDKKEGKEPIIKKRRPSVYEIQVYMFPQVWSSTALGFGGMGGQAITSAYTIIVVDKDDNASVFFGGQHAYTVKVSLPFMEDIKNNRMKPVSQKNHYDNKE